MIFGFGIVRWIVFVVGVIMLKFCNVIKNFWKFVLMIIGFGFDKGNYGNKFIVMEGRLFVIIGCWMWKWMMIIVGMKLFFVKYYKKII